MNPSIRPALLAALLATGTAAGTPTLLEEPSQDRWMYPSNGTPGTRSQASTFSALPAASGLDDRWGFFLIAFDTSEAVPPGLPAAVYQIHSAKVAATISQDLRFTYDPSYDAWHSYGTPAVPAATVDTDPGRPLELHGAGFRNGWTAASFVETSSHGPAEPGTRNAFPLGFDTGGGARDVSNNITGQFESIPWAVGTNHSLAPGTPVPLDSVFDFQINPSLPGVDEYLKQGLAAGRIWFSLSSLHPATQQAGEFVAYYTRDNVYHQLFGGLAPTLTLQASLDLKLSITRSAGQVTLSWPQFAGFTHRLEASPDLAASSWVVVHSHAAVTSGQGVFTESPAAATRFYRLALTKSP
jgi:hypothetical protein